MTACLRAGTGPNMHLHPLPLLAKQLESFQEPEMFLTGPPTSTLRGIGLL